MAYTPGRRAGFEGGAGPTITLFGGRGRLLALLAGVLFVLWLARGIMGPFVVGAVLAYAFSPLVSAVEDRTRLPRVVIVGVGYAAALGLLALVAVIVAERAGSEINYLTSGGPDIIATALRKLFGDQIIVAGMTYQTSDLAAQIRNALLGMIQTPSDAIHMAEQAVDIALQAILTLIVTFYFILDGRRFGDFALRFLDRSQRADALRIGRHIHVVLGRWLRGQLLLIALVAAVLYVVLGPILHIPYALALSLLSGVLEIIPLVGPIIAAALAGTVAFATHGPDTTLVVLAVYLVVRQVEDQIIMPVVIGRAVHLHPVVTIFAVLVGLSAFGVLGGLLGVPVAAALNVTLHELYPEETAPQPAKERSRVRIRLPLRPAVAGEGLVAAQERATQARPAAGAIRRQAARRIVGRAAPAESERGANMPGEAAERGVREPSAGPGQDGGSGVIPEGGDRVPGAASGAAGAASGADGGVPAGDAATAGPGPADQAHVRPDSRADRVRPAPESPGPADSTGESGRSRQ
jgi:predicted PurR-regulated permease PerM